MKWLLSLFTRKKKKQKFLERWDNACRRAWNIVVHQETCEKRLIRCKKHLDRLNRVAENFVNKN